MKRKIFSILLTLVLITGLSLVTAVPAAGVDDYDSSLTLENKDADWVVIPDGTSGTLEYNSSGAEFEYSFTAAGIADGDYSLIYYADYSGDRFGEWGGNNPGAVIATFTASGNSISASGSVDLGMDLPCPPDANISEHDYSGTPDNYLHAHGAKIWLVPTSALTSGNLPVQAWPPDDNWLFETDLIYYDDTDTLILENKDADWAVIPDGISGTLQYNSEGLEFEYSFTAAGIADGDYSLIYYADYSGDRFGDWGGDNPGALIATFMADESGNIPLTTGSVDLGMSLPCSPDANISEHDYSGTPDYYPNAHGAKIWLVPTSALTSGNLPVQAWPPDDNWLFETDLITYTDTGATVPADSTGSTATDSTNITATTGSGGGATVEVTEYTAPPEGEPVFGALGTYVDVHCDTPENLTEVIIKVFYDGSEMTDAEELALRVSYWNSDVSDWRQCSDQGVDIANDFIWAKIRDDTTPDLSYLATSTFGAGSMTMELDDWYTSGDTVDVTIEDAEQSGLIAAFAWSDTVHPEGKITFALTETDTGIFEGSFDLVSTTPGAGELLVNDGDVISVAYMEVVGTATVDDTDPVVTITAPVDGDDVAGASVSIDGTIVETNEDTVSVKIDGTEVATALSYTWDTTAEGDGTYTIEVVATDLAGNSGSDSVDVTVDNTDPVITLQVATPPVIMPYDEPGDETEVTFTATVADVTSGVDTVTIDLSPVGGGAVAMLDAGADGIYTASENITESDEADYELTVTANDMAGNSSGTAVITLGVWSDIIDPVITDMAITYPFVGVDSAMPGDDVTISATVTDVGGMDTVTAACTAFEGITPASLTQDGDAWSETVTVKTDAGWGDYTVTITATDAKGNDATNTNLELAVRSGATGYALNLFEGWNLISLPLIPDDSDISVVISATTLASADVSNIGIIRAYDSATGGFPLYTPDTGIGDLAAMEDGVGYWVFMEADDTLTITGTQWPVPPTVPPVYPVVEGWNLIGFKSMDATPDEDYLASLHYYEEYEMYPVLWSYNATAGAYENVKGGTMEVGHGFWIWMTEPMVIVPPQ